MTRRTSCSPARQNGSDPFGAIGEVGTLGGFCRDSSDVFQQEKNQ